MKKHNHVTKQSEMTLAVYRVVLPSSAVIMAAIILAIPGYYETTTLWYKTGIDRTMLLAGQYCGLTALLLIYIQVIMALRDSILSKIFGATNLTIYHRINGALITFVAITHVLLVLVPEGLTNLPVGWKFWPEIIGASLLLIIALLAVTSYFRNTIHLPFRLWKLIHKPAGYLAVILATVHVLFVSESFEQIVPRILLISLFLIVLFITTAAHARHPAAREEHHLNHRRQQ